MTNSFVSLYFTSDKLLLLKLASSGKKVELRAEISLPQGIIKNHRISDIKSLSVILKRVWQKLKIKEKSVGIVIPEFSTFTKAIDLPKIDISELDEAVKWQSEEYFPLDKNEMIVDWKIISESEGGYRILAVAVNSQLLKDYVTAADQAGIFPMIVETPSISLVRAAGEDEKVKLVIYFSYDEAIITLSKGSEILTSSVLETGFNAQALLATIGRIIRHFEDVGISKIYVGGMPSDGSYLPYIADNLKLPMQKLEYKVEGLSASEMQKYMIPLSLQFKNPSVPASTKTINLLPQETVDKYKGKKRGVQVWGVLLIVTLIMVGCLMALTGTYFYIVQGLSKYNGLNTLSDTSYQKSKTASDIIKNVNTVSERTIKIDSISVFPQEILNMIYAKKPENIAIINYKIDFEEGKIRIMGVSAGRDDLFLFKKNLEDCGEFQNIDLPLTSFEQGENIEFEMSFECRKLVPSQTKTK